MEALPYFHTDHTEAEEIHFYLMIVCLRYSLLPFGTTGLFSLAFCLNSGDAIFSTSFLHGRGNSSVFFHFDARLAMQREIRKILLLLL
jgi:hypothetical protein